MRWTEAHHTMPAPITCSSMRPLVGQAALLVDRRRDKMHFAPGYADEIFERVGDVYRKAKAAKGITQPIMYELAEDDTTVPGASEFNQRFDSIIGFCGLCAAEGRPHVCDPQCNIVIGEGDDAYAIIESSHANYQLAGYLRVVVVNPLHCALPRLTVVVHPHCNRMDIGWFRKDWAKLVELAERFVTPSLGDCLGHASDGDERR